MSMKIDLQVLSSFDFIITTSTGDSETIERESWGNNESNSERENSAEGAGTSQSSLNKAVILLCLLSMAGPFPY